jgi:hypothetical protein
MFLNSRSKHFGWITFISIVIIFLIFLEQFRQQSEYLLHIASSLSQEAITPVKTLSKGFPSRIENSSSSSPLENISSSSSSSSTYRYNLIICGAVKNVQPHLIRIRDSIHQLIHQTPFLFHLSHILFLEHNSTDNTVQELQTWSQFFVCNVTVLSGVSYEPERTVRLAQARNRLWQEISYLSSSTSTIDFVLMMDMDDVNWHLSNLDQCLQLPPDWSVCCCNSYKVYYDLWALRVLNESQWLLQQLDRDRSRNTRRPNSLGLWTSPKPFRHIPASQHPIAVESCFGGAALYRYGDPTLRMIAESNPYQGLSRGTKGGRTIRPPVCEHVSFHRTLSNHNLRLYIQPKFLNDGPSDERMLYFGAVKMKWRPLYQQSWSETPQYYRNFFSQNLSNHLEI